MVRKAKGAPSPHKGAFGGGSTHTAYSDFAHLSTPVHQVYALSLGNDGSDIEKLKAEQQAK
jgi:hypothetical protein